MKIIIDTHILLWWASNDRRLPDKARRLIENSKNNILVSALEETIEINNFESLFIKLHHPVEVSELPPHHRDPFDRMLIAQAISETAYLLTHDEQLERYGRAVMVV